MVRQINVHPYEAVGELDRTSLMEIIDDLNEYGAYLIVDSRSIFSGVHLASAILHAARSILSGRSRANDQAVEVMRWIAGVHQVSEGIRMVSPSADTKQVLIIHFPDDWPEDPLDRDLPEISLNIWKGKEIPGLVPMGNTDPYGGMTALKVLNIPGSHDISQEEAEMSVLERICSPDLR